MNPQLLPLRPSLVCSRSRYVTVIESKSVNTNHTRLYLETLELMGKVDRISEMEVYHLCRDLGI